jgi:hypothetical protein
MFAVMNGDYMYTKLNQYFPYLLLYAHYTGTCSMYHICSICVYMYMYMYTCTIYIK